VAVGHPGHRAVRHTHPGRSHGRLRIKGLPTEIETDVFGRDPNASRRIHAQRSLRDVADHAAVVVEQVDGFRGMLADILTVNTALVTQAQNEQIKRISSWAAILFAPTLIGTVYGMNFRHMPELGRAAGYPFTLLLMAAV
jgi:Mg2+ and Co2+ transporter CorA